MSPAKDENGAPDPKALAAGTSGDSTAPAAGTGADAGGIGKPPADRNAPKPNARNTRRGGDDDEDDDPVEDEVREPCRFLAPGKGDVKAFIIGRSSADANVCEIVLRDGSRISSVPKWNQEGPRPPFAVWIENT